jgi:hemerythrin-like domain-containing protein
MHEHRLIEEVLASLESFISQDQAGAPEARRTLGDYVRFFREFADRCHHGKEEDRLFVKMAEHGFSTQWGPLKVMLEEHTVGRGLVKQLAAIASGDGPLNEEELTAVRLSAIDFIRLLRAHIQKEDQILYPAAVEAVPGPVMDALSEEFERFELEVMGAGAHERLHALAEALVQAHPPS